MLVDNQAVQRIANTDPSGFGIGNDGLPFSGIAFQIEIGMTDACPGFNNGQTGFLSDKLNKLGTPSRDEYIYIPLSL
jgi:hypothetical protein